MSTRALTGRDITRALGAAAISLALLAPAASAKHSATTCAGQDVPITAQTIRQAERASLCLLNLHRSENGLHKLTLDDSLLLAARRHSEDMVKRNYFDHEAKDTQNSPAPYGRTPGERAMAAGYPSPLVGENIVASSYSTTSPHDLFNLWRDSPGHNTNMLRSSYVTVGIGMALGTPNDGPAGATATQLFGTVDNGGTNVGASLEGGDPDSAGTGGDGHGDDASPCEQAKADRDKAKRKYRKAKRKYKRSKRKFQRLKQAGGPAAKKRKAKKQAKRRKKKAVAKRSKLRSATEAKKTACA